MSELKSIWHSRNEVPEEGDFIAFLTPSGNLLTGNFEGKTDRGFFVIKNRAFEYATMDVVDQWAHVEDLKTIDSLRARIGELEKETAPFRDPYFKGLSMSAVAELAKKSIKMTEQHNKDASRVEELEDALKEISISGRIRNNDKKFQKRIETIIEEALKGAGK